MITNNLSNVSGAATFLALQMLAEGGSDVSDAIFVANYTYANNAWSCDKTFSEIGAAYDAGKICLGMATDSSSQIIYVGSVDSSKIIWFSNSVAGDQHGKVQMIRCVTHNSDNSIAVAPMSSSVLPGVTSSDNGKILGVSSGQWNTIDLPQDIFVATYTYTNSAWSCDKTFAEIKAAYDAGKPCLAMANGYANATQYRILSCDSSAARWTSYNNAFGVGYVQSYGISHFSSGSIENNTTNSPTLPSVTSSDNGKVLGVSSGEWNKVDPPVELPAVTSSDNGKILGVSSGEWNKIDPPQNTFVATYTYANNAWSCDKTFAEIKAAYDAGKTCLAMLGLYGLGYLRSSTASQIKWAATQQSGSTHGAINTITLNHNSNETFTANMNGVTDYVLPSVTSSDNGKILGVSSGQWNKIDPPQDVFVATYTRGANNAWSCDKTFSEIKAAYDAGKLCLANFGSLGQHVGYICGITDSRIDWYSVLIDGYGNGSIRYNIFFHNNDDTFWTAVGYSNVLPSVTSSDNGKVLGVSNGRWDKVDPPTELPTVTSSDNGKVLGVSNGVWDKIDIHDPVSFTFNCDYVNQYVISNISMTNQQIYDAIEDGRFIYGISNDHKEWLINNVTYAEGEHPVINGATFITFDYVGNEHRCFILDFSGLISPAICVCDIIDGRDGLDGVDGRDGVDGQDGYSPTVSIVDNTSVTPYAHTITITDVDGAHTTTIYDGQNGFEAVLCIYPELDESFDISGMYIDSEFTNQISFSAFVNAAATAPDGTICKLIVKSGSNGLIFDAETFLSGLSINIDAHDEPNGVITFKCNDTKYSGLNNVFDIIAPGKFPQNMTELSIRWSREYDFVEQDYIETFEYIPKLDEPLIADYTVTGQSGSDYTLSTPYTLAQMQAAKSVGGEIKARLVTVSGTLELPLISYGSGFMAFSNVTYYGNEWVVFQITTRNDGVSDTSIGQVVPIQQQLPSAQGVSF